jgi:hypothetical protein
MLRKTFNRTRGFMTLLAILGVAGFATSCGSGDIAAKEMVLLELQFLDRSLQPTAPTGTQSLPRNAIVGMVFSELVNPYSVTNQTIQLRFGGSFQSVPAGSFSVNGSQVLFDPTITAQGQPNPVGFDPVTQYILDIPGVEEQSQVLENLDGDPNLVTFFTQFTTAPGWLRELDPPELVDVYFIPGPDPLTKQIPGNGIMAIEFTEAMDPASFEIGIDQTGPQESTTLDIRYTDASINMINLVDGSPLPGTVEPSPDFKTFFYRPLFSFGSDKLVFTCQVFQGLTDLSGNGLINPQARGPFTCDGTGLATGKVISENFLTSARKDPVSDADWGQTTEGTLQGQPVSSRSAYIMSYVETDNGSNSGRGQYAPIAAPLIGADINNYAINVNPPSAQGRRVMWAFSDTKMGQEGSITAYAWGPDSNATFAAFYEDVKLRVGYQATNSLSLAPQFSGNYEGGETLVYNGDYQVQQAANIGNSPGEPMWNHVGGYNVNPGCSGNWNAPLFAATGFYAWPEPSTFFEWNPGDLGVENDRVLIFDASVPEGDTFQQVRGWFGVTYPCSGVLIQGLPLTRMYATYEEDVPNPESNFIAGIQNPEQSVTDTCFTITKRVSIGQSEFYTLAAGETFGDASNYYPAVIAPNSQAGGAKIVVEYQGADAVEADNVTINQAAPFTGWVRDINKCDGYQNLRWRIQCISNLISLDVAKVTNVVIPLTDNTP